MALPCEVGDTNISGRFIVVGEQPVSTWKTYGDAETCVGTVRHCGVKPSVKTLVVLWVAMPRCELFADVPVGEALKAAFKVVCSIS